MMREPMVTMLCNTLPETNMETQKGLYKDYSPFKRGLYESQFSLGCTSPPSKRNKSSFEELQYSAETGIPARTRELDLGYPKP